MTPAPKRRWLRFSLRSLLVAVVVVAALMGWAMWKRDQVRSRGRLLDLMFDKGAVNGYGWTTVDEWSTTWPFYAVPTMYEISLVDGNFTDDDVRWLRGSFPGVQIRHATDAEYGNDVLPHVLEPEGNYTP